MENFNPGVDSQREGGAMEFNPALHYQHLLAHTQDLPGVTAAGTAGSSPLLYMAANQNMSGLSEAELQAQILQLEKQYRLQEQVLSRQFEEQRRMLAHEQQSKMQDYIKMMMLHKQQQQLYEQQKQQQQQQLEEQQRMADEQQRQQKMDKLNMIKNKGPGEESAVASNEVKQKLRECLLNKGHRGEINHLKNSPPEFRNWSRTQHSSLEQHSPPTSGLSPPLRSGHHLLGRYDDEYPLRKTVSEPNLKMRSSKMSLRQKVMQRNSPLLNRRDLLKKKLPLTTSEPNLKVRLALKQKMIERRSSPLLKRKDRLHLVAAKLKTTPLTIDTTSSSTVDSDSGPNSPPGSSQGSGSGSGEMNTPQKEETAITFPLQMMSKMMQSMPNISIGQPRDKVKQDSNIAVSMSLTDAELHARAAAAHYAGLPLLGYYPMAGDGAEMSPTNPALVEAQMKALELARSTGQLPLGSPDAPGMPGLHLPPHAMPYMPLGAGPSGLADVRLHRTRSEPLPLPGQLLLQQQLLMQQSHQQQKQQEQILKDNHKHYLRQKLQSQLLQRSGSKNHMENVDEAAEARLVAEMKEIREKEEQDVVVIDEDQASAASGTSAMAAQPSYTTSKAFLRQFHQRALSGEAASTSSTSSSGIPLKPLERAQSNPIIKLNYPKQPTPPLESVAKPPPTTGVAFDMLMLKHQCDCRDNSVHPENPDRLDRIWARITESGLLSRCQKIKCRKATAEELQTCHSEAYVHIYGSSSHKWDRNILEAFMLRFGKLPCGGIGVDSDTVWNELYTPQAARMAAGSVIELAFKVATQELKNGFALVRPPGHHAEDTQAMGFCYFNSIAVATKLLLERLKLKKILILDWDVHHGNSTQQLFYTDPRVLYISLHRHDNGNFFPGTGAPEDCGIDRGVGFNVNVAFCGALNPPMGDAEYMAAFRTVVMPIVREFDPELVLVSAGFDAASGHPAPLGGYNVSPECFGHMTKQMLTLAGGKVALVLEGGYVIGPMCDAAEMCLRALLGDEIPPPRQEEVTRTPCPEAVETILTTFKCQEQYWPCLRRLSGTVGLSLAEALRREKDEADTVSAFASLSVLPSESAGQSSTATIVSPQQQEMEQAASPAQDKAASPPLTQDDMSTETSAAERLEPMEES